MLFKFTYTYICCICVTFQPTTHTKLYGYTIYLKIYLMVKHINAIFYYTKCKTASNIIIYLVPLMVIYGITLHT